MACVDEQTVLNFVDGRLAGDELSRVGQHVAACTHCAELVVMAAGRTGSIGPLAGVISDSAGSVARGTIVGRYVILELLGAGGMGEVYAAFDPDLERKVAIKFLRRELVGLDGGEQAAERLRREARVVAKLSHPNVVVVHEIGVHGDRVFIAMEHVDGETVSHWLRAAPRSVAEVLSVFVAAGRGLSAAHAAGVVHRDFKPQNVMLSKSGEVRVMDFGLAGSDADGDPPVEGADPDVPVARSGSGRTPVGPRITRTGALLGTPAYMAPEQIRGEKTSAKTDQYSFCIALHEALLGRRPSQAATPGARSIPSWLRGVLQRGLARAPEDRYASMDDLLADLARDRSKRRRLALGVAAALCLIGAGIWGALQARAARGALVCRGGAARAAAVFPLRDAMHEAFLRTHVGDAEEVFERVAGIMSTYLQQWSARYTDACEATEVRGEQSRDVLQLRMACMDERLDAARALTETLVRADALVVAHAVDAALGLPDLDRCSELVVLRAAVKPPDGAARRVQVDGLRRRLAQAKLLAATGHFDQVSGQLRALEQEIRQADYPPLLVDFLLFMHADVWANAGLPIAQPEIVREALRVAQAAGYEEGIAAALVGLVGVYYRNPDLADIAVEQADATLRHLGDPVVLRAWLENNLSISLFSRGQIARAEQHARRALALKEQRTPRNQADVALTESNICMFLQELGHPDQALAHCQRAVSLSVGQLGPGHPHTVNFLENQASVLADLGRLGEACPQAARVRAFFAGNGQPTDTRTGLALTTARCALADGHPAAARDQLQRTLAEAVRTGAETLELADVEWQLARATWETGDRAHATELAQSAAARYAKLPELAFRRDQIRDWLAR